MDLRINGLAGRRIGNFLALISQFVFERAFANEYDAVEGGDLLAIPIGALAGARLRFKATIPKRSALEIDVLALVDPTGALSTTTDLVKQKGRSTLVDAPLGVSGTWILRLRVRGSGTGKIATSFKLKQPKGVQFSAD